MRVYIPATLTMLQQLVADGSMHARSGTAFAVTPKLRESYFEGDEDELGEVALREAALASLRLLAAEGTPAESKAGAVASALGGADEVNLPAAGATGRSRTLWLLDRQSASALSNGAEES